MREFRPVCSLCVLTILPPFSFSSFFFYASRPHRDLHSFPTRRSSDLRLWPANRIVHLAASVPLQRTVPGRWRRSEEHTSELQSRFDLVCRLLLEKKK